MKWCIGFILAGMATGVMADDWPVWRGPTADGISVETGWQADGMKIGWTVELGQGYSSVSVKEGRLFTMGNVEESDVVYCLDAKTGKQIWTHSYACESGKFKGPRSTPVWDEDKIFTLSRDGRLLCLNAEDGAVVWDVNVLEGSDAENIKWGLASSPVISGDLLLLNVGESGMALRKATGEVMWKSSGKGSYASPVVFNRAGTLCAAMFTAPGLRVVDVLSGKRLESFEWETKYLINGADPVMIGDQIFISSGYGRGCALLSYHTTTFKKVWENDVLKNQFSSSVHLDGYLYGVDGQTKKKGFLRCIAVEDGEEQWNMPVGFGSLMVADGKLIVLGEGGVLYIAEASAEKYSELAQFDTGLGNLCWTPPVLANGLIYCRNDKGTLIAVDVSQ